MKKIISRGALFSLIVAVLSLIIFLSGCGGSEIQGLENSGSTVDGSSVSKSLYSADKDESSKQCLYSKVTYTLDNGKIITYQFDPETLSAVAPSKSATQETRSSGATRQAYDGMVMGLGDSKAAYVTDKLVATTNAYTFFLGGGFAEEYIVCPEPSVSPESNIARQGVTVVPSIESGLGPITYTPTAPSFTGAVHIVANYFIPDDPPKPWHESWEYVYLVGNPVPVLTQYYSENGIVMGLQFTMGMGSDTENVALPRTLGDWHFISNNNMAHSDDIIKMRELSIKDPVTFVADDKISNKIKVQAEIEELPAGSWTANIARAKDVIVDPNTQETSTIDLIWDPAKKYLAGDWIYNSGVITAALSKGFSLTAREIADSYMHTITAYEDTVKTFAMKSAGQQISKLTIENAKSTPEEFTPGKKEGNNKTNITAQIAANSFQADSIKWQVTIKDEADATVKTFDERTGVPGSGLWDVSETWNGKNDSGDYVDYGDYTFNIKATAKTGNNSIEATASGSVTVSPPEPELVELTFPETTPLEDDEGKKIPDVYFEKNGDKITQNPVAVPLSYFPETGVIEGETAKETLYPCSAKAAPFTKYETITFQLPKDVQLVKPVKYIHRIRSPRGDILLDNLTITFNKTGEKVSKKILLGMKNRIVQVIQFLNVDYKPQPSKKDWKTYKFSPQKPIYIPLEDTPKKPFTQVPENIMIIACQLATGANNETDVRNLMLPKLWTALGKKQFNQGIYKSDLSHFKGKTFQIQKFLNDPAGGDCNDASALYACLCSALGVDMKLAKLYTLAIFPPPIKDKIIPFGWNTQYATGAFNNHQTGYLDGVFDPTYLYVLTEEPFTFHFAIQTNENDFKSWVSNQPNQYKWDPAFILTSINTNQ